MKSNKLRIIVAATLIAVSPAAFADDDGGRSAAIQAEATAKPASKIASSFVVLAGSRQNAVALVNGLRNGTPIVLQDPPSTTGTGTTGTGTTGTGTTGTGTPSPSTTTITPATGHMGWGNVRIALALAEHTLAANGITKPTPEQLNAALNGGDITVKTGTGSTATTRTVTLNGVLTERASGMGWGQVAKAEGTTVGAALRDARTASAPKPTHAEVEHHEHDGGKAKAVAVKATTPANSTTASATGTKSVATGGSGTVKGVTTAAGASAPKGITTAAGAAAPKAVAGRGIVTAAGTSGTQVAATHSAKAPVTVGVMTGTGSAASSVTTAQGNGGSGKGDDHGGGKGHKG